ncbi:MAG: TIGR03905 family TSCPD domain-containing protein [Erysipelotrichaceae bacterium]|nr:TIGR03905 family TSCPD domain-containing protein [Erysipelotrichaceae bacterium]
MRYSYTPQTVCASKISFDLDGDIVSNISFERGCPGNLKAISKLLEGKSVSYIEEMLRGNTCGYKNTSCADQLAIAVRKAYDASVKSV